MTKMLALQNLNVAYGNLQVVWDVSLKVKRGEIVALLGLNGAGKTTTLKAIAGILSPLSGSVILNGENVTGVSTYQLVKKGLVFVPEERNLFPAMSVHENLLMGAYIIRNKKQVEENLEYVLSLFPRLAERSKQLAGTLSGGESQMLAIARGLMTRPRMFMLDEPSMGLSPKNVEVVFETIEKLKKEMVTIIIVEQNVNTTLAFSDRAYVMEQGQIMMEGASEKVSRDENVRKLYLGIA
jgi:branched-chain amino acid transport system ATP-binding protein